MVPSKCQCAVLVTVVVLWSGSSFGQFVNPANGHVYYQSDGAVSLTTARSDAAFVGGFLVTVNDAAEEQWLLSTFGTTDDFWIGLSDEIQEGTFVWDSGEPFVYENWQTGAPLGQLSASDWVIMEAAFGGQWIDTSPSMRAGVALVELLQPLPPRVTGLLCSPEGVSVRLTWQNGAPYDQIEVYRDGALVSTLPGAATEYLDAAAVPPVSQYFVAGRVAGSGSFPVHCSSGVVDANYQLRLSAGQLLVPGSVTVASVLDSTAAVGIGAFSYGVCHDSSVLELTDVTRGAAILAIGNIPAFEGLALESGGYTASVIVSLLFNVLLPDELDLELYVASYEALVPPPATTQMQYCDTLGTPPVEIWIGAPSPSHVPLVGAPAIVSVEEAGFSRGDCNADDVLNVADGIFLGNYLLSNGTVPDCIAACDVNSDGDADLADMISVFSYLFTSGTAPGDPFPGCGPDPLITVLPCDSPAACP